ncbi:MAG: hypothetical protein DMG86_04380 [Acidobacteria bacterium]|nr:MAG: hypothetical protein DMG86_04380 [Acidobacteriota bacterium]
MKRSCLPLVFIVLISLPLHAQLDRLVIPAGTPEDQALQAISNEQDAQKKLAMYEDFLQKFAANPTAVAYGNWQISQYQLGAGNPQKALDYGDKALTGSPRNLDILVSQANIAQLMKNNGKIVGFRPATGGRKELVEGFLRFPRSGRVQRDCCGRGSQDTDVLHRAIHSGLPQFTVRRVGRILCADVAFPAEGHVAACLLR